MSQENFQTLLNFFKALANENRLKLLGVLAHQERSVEELAALLNVKEPTISHHLTKLKALNLVKMRAEGNTHYYHLDSEGLQAITKTMFTPENIGSLVEDQSLAYDAWERKVLGSFIEGGRLIQIPASRKKRSVILRWLVDQFEPDRRYPEAELNEILKRYHPDCATLRREFIGAKLMAREGGVYWRLPTTEDL